MKQTQRSSTAARTRGPIQSETLENRRLFAGMPFGHNEFAHGGFGHGEFVPHAGGRFWGEAMIVTLALGGQMRLTNNAISTTAVSTFANAAINAAAGADTASATPVPAAVTVSTSAATRAAAIAVTHHDTAVPDQADGDLVQQIMADRTPAAATRSSVAGSSNDFMPTDSGVAFGPFTLGPAAAPVARPPMEDGFGSLLTLNPDAVDRSLRWQSQDATYRPRRPANPTATTEELPQDLARAATTATADQAGLAPVAAGMATRPLWQRVAAMAAGGLLVAANVLVRRRRAQQSAKLGRR